MDSPINEDKKINCKLELIDSQQDKDSNLNQNEDSNLNEDNDSNLNEDKDSNLNEDKDSKQYVKKIKLNRFKTYREKSKKILNKTWNIIEKFYDLTIKDIPDSEEDRSNTYKYYLYLYMIMLIITLLCSVYFIYLIVSHLIIEFLKFLKTSYNSFINNIK